MPEGGREAGEVMTCAEDGADFNGTGTCDGDGDGDGDGETLWLDES
jgi:hypothetical protein